MKNENTCPNEECDATYEDIYFIHAFDIDENGEADTWSDPDEFHLCMVCKTVF